MTDASPDPLSTVVALLRPRPSAAKLVEGRGRWRVERSDMASPFYAVIVSGNCRLTVMGREPLALTGGDFVLIPDLHDFAMSSEQAPPPNMPSMPMETGPGIFRLGPAEAPIEFRALVGHCRFALPARALLLSLLPETVHLSGHDRLMALVPMIHEETRADRPARGMILDRLLEVLMVEALRSDAGSDLAPGLVRGLSDPQIATALALIHAEPPVRVTAAKLAREAGLSRSAFFERFRSAVGCAPMEYVTAWRMAVARELLLRGGLTNAKIAQRLGFSSASGFSMAFLRHEGMSPSAFVGQKRDSSPEILTN